MFFIQRVPAFLLLSRFNAFNVFLYFRTLFLHLGYVLTLQPRFYMKQSYLFRWQLARPCRYADAVSCMQHVVRGSCPLTNRFSAAATAFSRHRAILTTEPRDHQQQFPSLPAAISCQLSTAASECLGDSHTCDKTATYSVAVAQLCVAIARVAATSCVQVVCVTRCSVINWLSAEHRVDVDHFLLFHCSLVARLRSHETCLCGDCRCSYRLLRYI